MIGAGISGVAAAKNLREDGLSVVVFEATDHVGGLWQFTEDGYGVMRFTHINVSKHNYCFSDFPFPEDTPDYPHWSDMAKYINAYVDHFDVRRLIRFNTRVVRAAQADGGAGWRLETEDARGQRGEVRVRNVVVATGHHAKPIVPTFPGQEVRFGSTGAGCDPPRLTQTSIRPSLCCALQTFPGEIYHSVQYKDCRTNKLEGRRVLVVGIGNSAGRRRRTGTARPACISRSRTGIRVARVRYVRRAQWTWP